MSTRVQWRYVAPNVVTSIGIAVGMLSIAAAVRGQTPLAAWLVIVAVLVDKLDGTIARLLGASSRFGEQMDSFSDLITFGVAPAAFFLSGIGAADPLYRVVAYACAILYVIAAALRLSKFNLFSSYYGKAYFFGAPTTLCGALLASGYLTLIKYSGPAILVYFMPVAHAGLALLMVSNVALPKLGRRDNVFLNWFQGINVALVYVIGFTWFLLPHEYRFPEYLLLCAVVYLVAGITSAQLKGVQAPPLPPPPVEGPVGLADPADLGTASADRLSVPGVDGGAESDPTSPSGG